MPSAARIDCGVSIISSSAIAPGRASAAARAPRRLARRRPHGPASMTLGIVTTKFARQPSPRRARERRDEDVERAQAARVQLLRHRLDADADERRQRSRRQPPRLPRRPLRVAVFFGVGPDAVAVLEVDAEVFDRLARELFDDAGANRVGEPGLRPAPSPSARRASRASARTRRARSAQRTELLRRSRP